MKSYEIKLNSDFSSPVLVNYVWWVLRQAIKQKQKTIYFLARDGYLLREIALQFCREFNLNIECRYLYCSRKSLRMPSYHLIGDEMFELLFLRTKYTTLHSFLSRASLSDEERQSIYMDIGWKATEEEKQLTVNEIQLIESKIRDSKVFRELIFQKSLEAYPSTIGYFKQEGLFQQDNIFIVDSGWTGSMQRAMRQLLQSAGFNGKITGLYFGMYVRPKSPEDGEYLTWYFNHESSFLHRVKFNNNLFECILSAPHPMTVGYTYSEGKYIPVQSISCGEKEMERIYAQITMTNNFTKKYLKTIQFNKFDRKSLYLDTRKRIRRYMVYPRKEEVLFYGDMMFCDDVTEGYHMKLAASSQLAQLRNYIVPVRIMRKLMHKQGAIVNQEMLWPFGTLVFLPKWKQSWYRWNIIIWEWVEYVRKKVNEQRGI